MAGGTNIFAGSSGSGVFLSTDNGTNWIDVNNGLTNGMVWTLAVYGTNIFAGTLGSGLFLSTDNGTNWFDVNNELLTNTEIHSLVVSGSYLFAATGGGGVWRRPLSDMITSVEIPSFDLLTCFSLSQNYPNPFNPSTKLSYSITQSGLVILKVYDVLGTEVETLVNEEKPIGTYELTWNAANLPSGIYFYQLRAGEYTAVKKMLLVK